MTNTVSLCMICKNEQNNIGLLLDDVCQVLEEVIIVDTGSTDNTLAILAEKSKQYPNLRIEHFQWVDNFSAARNYSFSLATQDFIFWCDGDDRVDSKDLFKFKNWALVNPNVDCWLLDYIYSSFPDGSPQLTLGRERFLRRAMNPRWVGAIHEVIDINSFRQQYYNELKIVHNRGSKVIEPKRNLKILEAEFAKNPNDPRTAYYYGKELFDHVDNKGIEILEHYLTLPWRYYDDEVNARERLSRAYLALKDHGKAIRVANEIYHLDATRKRAGFYWIYGAVEQDLQNYEIAIDWYERCVVEPPPPPRVLTMEYYTWNPLRRISECYLKLNNYEQAVKHARMVKKLLPGDHGTELWYKENFSEAPKHKEGYTLLTMEFGLEPKLRWESYYAKELWVDRLDVIPLKDASLDGAVINVENCGEILRTIKPGGFLWSVYPLQVSEAFCLGSPVYRKQKIYNYIKTDYTKPSFGYRSLDRNFGPYRIRIENLIKSAAKQGHPVLDLNISEGVCDVFIGQRIFAGDMGKAKVLVLDVCEKLPSYEGFGFEYAHAACATSDVLVEHIKSLYPEKAVFHLDDHFEFQAEGWL